MKMNEREDEILMTLNEFLKQKKDRTKEKIVQTRYLEKRRL